MVDISYDYEYPFLSFIIHKFIYYTGDFMDEINLRVIDMANCILDGGKTVRQVAKITGYSKSTVHQDLTSKLQKIDYELYTKVRSLLDYNKKIRHIRGGLSTKLKYLKEPQ